MNMPFNDGAIRSSYTLPSIVGKTVKLRRSGAEWVGLCPFHSEKSGSFTIFDGGERFHCFGCGASGDVIDFVRQLHGLSFREAVAMITGACSPVATVRPKPPKPTNPVACTTNYARSIWQSSGSIAGTPAAAYLRARGIHCRLPESLGFARLRYPGGTALLPCLVALVVGPDNKIAGIQRTFVREDGSGKADVPTAKLSLGRLSGGAIRLAPVAAHLVITGGLEDGLSLQQEMGQAVWAVTGEGNMASLVLPASVQQVTIGADADESGALHARRAAERLAEQGRKVRIIRPLDGHKDFNSELMEASA